MLGGPRVKRRACKKPVVVFSLFCLVHWPSLGASLSTPHKLAGDLKAVRSEAEVDVIVQYQHVPTAVHHQKMARRGGKLTQELLSICAAAYRVPAKVLPDLEADSEIVHVSLNHVLHSAAAPPVQGYDYTPMTIGATNNTAAAGAGIGIAVIDSGIYPNADLKNPATGQSRIVYQQSFVPGTSDPNDYYGHGTHVAGSIAGNGSSSAGSRFVHQVIGIAPGANLINLRVLDQNGNGTDSQVIAAIQQAIALQSTWNIRIINLSLGRPVYESYAVDPLCQAVEAAWNAGIVVVVAAGNDGRDNSAGTNGYSTIAAPGNDPYVITVGAMKTEETPTPNDDMVASYSSKGPTLIDHIVKPDLVAPGESDLFAGQYAKHVVHAVSGEPASLFCVC